MISQLTNLLQFQVLRYHSLFIFTGNTDNLEEIQQNLDFSYVRILKMMYAKEPIVRLTAGSALAAFSFNNLINQKEIAEQGGVRFSCFVPFLQDEDEFFRCNSAFQVGLLFIHIIGLVPLFFNWDFIIEKVFGLYTYKQVSKSN